jgi:hypothetical protein
MDQSIYTYLPVASFSLAAGGLAVRFFLPTGPAKQTLIAAVLIFLLISSGILWWENYENNTRIQQFAKEIVQVIGNDKLTYKDIVGGTRQPDYRLINAAIELLLKEKRIGSGPLLVTDKQNKMHGLWVYYVRRL